MKISAEAEYLSISPVPFCDTDSIISAGMV